MGLECTCLHSLTTTASQHRRPTARRLEHLAARVCLPLPARVIQRWPVTSPPAKATPVYRATCWHASAAGASPKLLGDLDPGAGESDQVACDEVEVTDVPRPEPSAAADALKHLRFRGRESLTPFGRPLDRDIEGPTLPLVDTGAWCGEGDRSTSSDNSEATLPGGGA